MSDYSMDDWQNTDTEYQDEENETKSTKYVPNDADLAERYLIRHRLDTAYGQDEWKRYNPKNGLWKKYPEELISREIFDLVLDKARFEGVKPTSRMLNSIREIVRLKLYLEDDYWKIHPEYLPCANGVLHIPSRTLLPHTPDLHATSGLEYNYDPNAKAPAFMRALQPIKDAAEFLQEFAGYALTPDVKHEIAVWLKGPKGSGKSTVVVGLQFMLGHRAGLLGLADIERSRFALSRLPNYTLAVSTEQPETFIKASYVLNSIISGEEITIEQKFKDAVNIKPTAKILWAMNQLPRVSDPDDGIMRRVKVILFPELPESERDPEVKETVKTEGAGILNWALDGFDRLKNRGKFAPPPSVINATKDFQEKNDIPAIFLQDVNANYDPTYKIKASELYEKYKDWCIANGHKPMNSTRISQEWVRLGFERARNNGTTYYKGLYIPPAPPPGFNTPIP